MEHVKLCIKSKKTEILKQEENIKSVSAQLCNIKDILHRISKKIEVRCLSPTSQMTLVLLGKAFLNDIACAIHITFLSTGHR